MSCGNSTSPLPIDRNRNGRRNLSNRIPVGESPVASVSRAAVHEQGVGSGVDDRLRLLQIIAAFIVPTETDLGGDGDLHRALHGLDQAAHPIRLPSDGGAKALAGEVIDRTAKVDVDEVGPFRFHERSGPRHFFGVRAGKLHAETRFAGESADERKLGVAALLQSPRDRHLAHRDDCAQLHAQLTVREVRSFRHRRHDHGALGRSRTDTSGF